MESRTNYLAILVAALVGVATGWLWYRFLFLKPWMAGNGITMSEDGTKMFKHGAEMDMGITPMIVNFVGMLIYAYLLDWLMRRTGHHTALGGATIGAVIGLMMLIGIFIGNMFAGNPNSLSLVDGMYSLVSFVLMGAIIGAWRK